VIALVAGSALLVGALGGSRDILQPLAVYQSAAAAQGQPGAVHGLEFERVKTVDELQARLASAERPAMLDFYADWCVSCKEMERFTFRPRVREPLANVLLLQADMTANSEADRALLKRFGLFGPPGIIFFDASGSELPYRVVGYEPPDKFLDSLKKPCVSRSAHGWALIAMAAVGFCWDSSCVRRSTSLMRRRASTACWPPRFRPGGPATGAVAMAGQSPGSQLLGNLVPPCRAEMPAFIRMQEKYRNRGVVFVGIALDSGQGQDFVQSMGSIIRC
jgi:thiol-disulfide isomerase/thioredoxin